MESPFNTWGFQSINQKKYNLLNKLVMKTNNKYVIIEFNIVLTDYSQENPERKQDFLTFVYSSKEEAQSKFPEDLAKTILKKYSANFVFQSSFAEKNLKKEATECVNALLSDCFIYGVVDFIARVDESDDSKGVISAYIRGYNSNNDILQKPLPVPCYITNFYLEDGDIHGAFVYSSEEERKKNLFKDFKTIVEETITESLDKDIEEGIDGFWNQAQKEIADFLETGALRFDSNHHKESIFYKYDYNLSIILEKSANL